MLGTSVSLLPFHPSSPLLPAIAPGYHWVISKMLTMPLSSISFASGYGWRVPSSLNSKMLAVFIILSSPLLQVVAHGYHLWILKLLTTQISLFAP